MSFHRDFPEKSKKILLYTSSIKFSNLKILKKFACRHGRLKFAGFAIFCSLAALLTMSQFKKRFTFLFSRLQFNTLLNCFIASCNDIIALGIQFRL